MPGITYRRRRRRPARPGRNGKHRYSVDSYVRVYVKFDGVESVSASGASKIAGNVLKKIFKLAGSRGDLEFEVRPIDVQVDRPKRRRS